MMNDAKEMLQIAGIKNVKSFNAMVVPGQCIHEWELPVCVGMQKRQ